MVQNPTVAAGVIIASRGLTRAAQFCQRPARLKPAIQTWHLSFLLCVHFLVGIIKHFIQTLAFMPFGRTDADAYPKAIEMTCVIPLVKLLMNAFNDFFCSA